MPNKMETHMIDQIFPSWWGPPGGDPIQCRSAREVREGWVRHEGHYDAQIGQWVPRASLLAGVGGGESAVPAARHALRALRRAYKRRFGKQAFNGWDEATLRAKLERRR